MCIQEYIFNQTVLIIAHKLDQRILNSEQSEVILGKVQNVTYSPNKTSIYNILNE